LGGFLFAFLEKTFGVESSFGLLSGADGGFVFLVFGIDSDDDGVDDPYESDLADSDGDGISDQQDPDNDTDGGGVSNIDEKNKSSNPLDPRDDSGGVIAPTAVGSLQAEPGDKKITLFWSPAKDDRGIARYKILFGLSPDNLDQENQTPDQRTQWYVDGLMESQKYFFQVFAIDLDENIGTGSQIVEASTLGELKNSAPKTPTSGAPSQLPIWLALLSGVLFWFWTRRRS
jgi:hypothetical protein